MAIFLISTSEGSYQCSWSVILTPLLILQIFKKASQQIQKLVSVLTSSILLVQLHAVIQILQISNPIVCYTSVKEQKAEILVCPLNSAIHSSQICQREWTAPVM